MKLHLPLALRGDAFRLGWPGIAGLCLLAAAIGFALAVVEPAREHASAARASAIASQKNLVGVGAGQPTLTLPEQLAAFYANFPSEREATDSIGRIAAIAARHQLPLQQADYKAERDKGGKLTRLQMNIPLKGRYATIRQFLASVRTELPGVSLEQVQFERQKVGDATIDARIRLVIFLGAAA